MGNHHSQDTVHKIKATNNATNNENGTDSRKNSLKSTARYDIQEKENSLIHPVEKLAQVIQLI